MMQTIALKLAEMAWVGAFFLFVIILNGCLGQDQQNTIWTLLFVIFWSDLENRSKIKNLEEDVGFLLQKLNIEKTDDIQKYKEDK